MHLHSLDGQFRAVQDSLAAIQSWLQIPQSVAPVHATPTLPSSVNSTFTAAQGPASSSTSLATQGHTHGGVGDSTHNPQSSSETTPFGIIGQPTSHATGNSQSQLPYFANSINQGPPYNSVSFNIGPTYTNAGVRPRMSTGFNFTLDIVEGRGRQVSLSLMVYIAVT